MPRSASGGRAVPSDAVETCYLHTDLGWLRIAADATGLTEVSFIDEPPLTVGAVTLAHLKEAYRQLAEYFRGERLSFSLPVNPQGTAFQRSVWQRLMAVPFGSTISYKALAEAVGCPGGARAVGMANNQNPLAIVIPCHRVIGSKGDLVGYASGIRTKARLLTLEGVASA